MACHVLFIVTCVAYAGFRLREWRRGVARNGPKLIYLVTVIPIYYLAFTRNPLLAAFWVLMTGLGHCAQYHRIVWAYGTKKYVAPPETATPGLPARIFGNVWLYIVLGVAYGLVTLQGPGGHLVTTWIAGGLQSAMGTVVPFVDRTVSAEVSLKAVAAFISGVRLHHLYVDSKIWRVSRSEALAKNLSV